jgi:hypothetical protein
MNENVRKHEYFYLKLGVPRGPFTEQEFVELAKKGKIKASTSCTMFSSVSHGTK